MIINSLTALIRAFNKLFYYFFKFIELFKNIIVIWFLTIILFIIIKFYNNWFFDNILRIFENLK